MEKFIRPPVLLSLLSLFYFSLLLFALFSFSICFLEMLFSGDVIHIYTCNLAGMV